MFSNMHHMTKLVHTTINCQDCSSHETFIALTFEGVAQTDDRESSAKAEVESAHFPPHHLPG